MPVTALDPTTALIVVDLQAGLAGERSRVDSRGIPSAGERVP